MKKRGSLRFPIWFPIDITSYLSSYSFFFGVGGCQWDETVRRFLQHVDGDWALGRMSSPKAFVIFCSFPTVTDISYLGHVMVGR